MNLAYEVERSARRHTLTITVERDRKVVVHAPLGTTDETIRKVVEAKRQWIYEKVRHAQKYQDLPHPPGKELVNGESILYLGRQYRIEIVQAQDEQIRFDRHFIIPAMERSRQSAALQQWYLARARLKIIPRVEHHARELGVETAIIKIVDNRYRWGSCTPNNNVTFNWRLIKAPMFVIDYVIVHELAHLLEPNHTPRFWNIVRAQITNLDKARAWLKQQGQLLEQKI